MQLKLFAVRIAPSTEGVHDDNLLMLEHFYKRDKNEVLFRLYEILKEKLMPLRGKQDACLSAIGKLKPMPRQAESQMRFLEYNEICNEYNRRYRASNKNSCHREEKLKSVDVAGYSKKL